VAILGNFVFKISVLKCPLSGQRVDDLHVTLSFKQGAVNNSE